MLTAHALIPTATPERYLTRLAGHAERLQGHASLHAGQETEDHPRVDHVEQSSTDAVLTLSVGRCVLRSEPAALLVRVETATDAQLRQIQEIVGRDLTRLGHRDRLSVHWSDTEVDAPTGEA